MSAGIASSRARAPRLDARPRGSCAPSRPSSAREPVAVEDVVDDLEEQPELVDANARHGRCSGSGTAGDRRARSRPRPRRGDPSSASAAARGRRRRRAHRRGTGRRSSRASRATSSRATAVVGYESASRNACASSASPARIAVASPNRTCEVARPRRRSSSSSAGRSSWTSEKVCTSSSAAAAGSSSAGSRPTASPVARQSTGRIRLPPPSRL